MRRLLLVPLLALVPLAGCGSDDSSLSKEEHIEQTDALCRQFEADTDELPEPQTEAELADLLATAVERTTDFRDDVAAIEPPGDGEEVHDDFVAAIDETIEKAEAARKAAADGDLEAAGARFEEAQAAAASMNERLADYGFEDCAEN